VFQPGGLHVMLLDLKAPLKEGEHFPVTLTFEKAGQVTISVAVRRSAPAAGHGHSG
jgi:periplasmic copper chaperone A